MLGAPLFLPRHLQLACTFERSSTGVGEFIDEVRGHRRQSIRSRIEIANRAVGTRVADVRERGCRVRNIDDRVIARDDSWNRGEDL